MKPTSNLLLFALLAAPAVAQGNAAQRVPRPIPFQSSVKADAEPSITTPAVERAAHVDAAPIAASPWKVPVTEAERARGPKFQLDRVYYMAQPDGSTWASGNTYKAHFSPSGATYVPFLGSQAPRNFPLDLALVSASVDGVEIPLERAVSATRDGDRITIDLGMIDEVYELALDSVEQTFVVAERPAAGDLRLVVRHETEMTRSEDVDGFTYSNEHGSVHYGRAFVRESDGTRVPVESRAVEGGVEIVVGREYLSRATFPLVVDPVITTFQSFVSGADTWNSDIAYDASTDRTLTVFEYNASQSDGDIYGVMRAGDGSSSFLLLDNTVENWRGPKVANLNSADQFLMVAQVSNVTGAIDWSIWGMTVSAATTVNSFKFHISTTDQGGAKYLADVGGDPDPVGPAYYCVTWRRDFTVTDWDIHARLVTPAGTLVGSSTLFIDNSGSSRDSAPSISKSNGSSGLGAAWTIAWQRELSTTNYNVHGARIAWDGILLNGPSQLTTQAGYEVTPRPSSPQNDGRTLVVYGQDSTNDDLMYLLLSGTTINASGSLTALDAAPTVVQDQVDFSVDSDGDRFAVAYAESFLSSTFDYDIWVSTFAAFGNTLMATESHVSLDFSSAQARRTDIVAKRSGGSAGSNRFFVTYDSTTAVEHDVFGGIYDTKLGGLVAAFCFGNGSSGACPCTNNGGLPQGCPNSIHPSGSYLSTAGWAQTGAGDTLQFLVGNVPPNVSCTLFQGTSTNTVLFGDGLRCVSGTQIRIRTKPSDAAGTAVWPSGADPSVSVTGLVPLAGGQRYYQVSYRNSVSYCTPATFNISSGVSAQWLP